MDFIDIDEELNRLRITDAWEKAVAIAEMADTFPGLKLFREAGTVRFCAPQANAEVDMVQVDVRYDLEGWPVQASTWITIDEQGTRLYSNPPIFTIGKVNRDGFGWLPKDGWREELEAAGLDRFVILEVKDHLDRHAPVSY